MNGGMSAMGVFPRTTIEGLAKNGAQSGKQLKQFGWIHGIACPSENEIYVAELLNWRVQKLILHPEQQKAGR